MYFNSLSALLTMDGHGSYVWAAYGITIVVILALLVGPKRRQRRLLQQLSGELRRQQGAPQSTQQNPPHRMSISTEET